MLQYFVVGEAVTSTVMHSIYIFIYIIILS